MKGLAKFLNECIKSGDADDRLWAMAFLKDWGKLGKRLYLILPAGEAKEKLKENLFKLKDRLERI